MTPGRPAYLVTKPSRSKAIELACWRAQRRILNNYGYDRIHGTLLPLGEADDLPKDVLANLDRAFAALAAEPFDIAFNRLYRAELRGGAESARFCAFQEALRSCVLASGLSLPAYTFRPHVSLSYKDVPDQSIAISPIGWRVDEVLLIVSHHGKGKHELLRRWPLIERQMALPFAA